MMICNHGNNADHCAMRPGAAPCAETDNPPDIFKQKAKGETTMYRHNMNFEEYADALRALRTRTYPMMGNNLVYPAMGCAGEAGELLDKIKKHWRNKTSFLMNKEEDNGEKLGFDNKAVIASSMMSAASMTNEQRQEVIKEMGDVLWYLWAMTEEMNTSLSEVAFVNVEKLQDRKTRNVVCSEGDNR